MEVWNYRLSSDGTGINTFVMCIYLFMCAYLDTYIYMFMHVLYIYICMYENNIELYRVILVWKWHIEKQGSRQES